MKFKTIIGLEVHIELSTKSKMFCRCLADHFAQAPNTLTCPTCLGLPGALPYPNKAAIEDTILMGLAFKCKINKESKFDRKHYFYPDLPKSYQISQYDQPFCVNGYWLNKEKQKFGITRIHLEEDTAKLQHDVVDGKKVTLIDFNRSGVPLMEMVTEPDFEKPEDVIEFLKETQMIVRTLGISSGDMEKGSMRLEANISLATEDEIKKGVLPGYKVELKNINSFKFLQKAVEAEITRQRELLEKSENIIQETRGYDQQKGDTFSQRAKEEAHDYRYFPEPDIPPFSFTDEEVDNIKKRLPELPAEKRARYITRIGLPENYADIITQNMELSEYFDRAVVLGSKHNVSPKTIADIVINRKTNIASETPEELILKIVKLSMTNYLSEKETKKAIDQVLAENAEQVKAFQAGKVGILGFLIGQTQKKLNGQGDPKEIKRLLEKKIYGR